MSERLVDEYEAVLQRIAEAAGVSFPADAEQVVAAVVLLRDKEWNEALEAAEAEACRAGREASSEIERCNPDDVSGHHNYWLGNATMAGKLRAAIRALKREAK